MIGIVQRSSLVCPFTGGPSNGQSITHICSTKWKILSKILVLINLKPITMAEVFNLKLWTGKQTDWQPKARITIHGVGINTNLQPNEGKREGKHFCCSPYTYPHSCSFLFSCSLPSITGLHVKYHVMRSGADGEAVSMRISQQLIWFCITNTFKFLL